MMGTLASVLAKSKIQTSSSHYWADVEGDIEDSNDILKITQIRVSYHLRIAKEKEEDAQDAFAHYLAFCPAAQSVKNCIRIKDDLVIEGML